MPQSLWRGRSASKPSFVSPYGSEYYWAEGAANANEVVDCSRFADDVGGLQKQFPKLMNDFGRDQAKPPKCTTYLRANTRTVPGGSQPAQYPARSRLVRSRAGIALESRRRCEPQARHHAIRSSRLALASRTSKSPWHGCGAHQKHTRSLPRNSSSPATDHADRAARPRAARPPQPSLRPDRSGTDCPICCRARYRRRRPEHHRDACSRPCTSSPPCCAPDHRAAMAMRRRSGSRSVTGAAARKGNGFSR
jgi:hypothetical protein